MQATGGRGQFVMNARDERRRRRPGLPFTAEERNIMKRITVAVSTVVLSACGSEPTGSVAPTMEVFPPSVLAAKAAATTSPTVAIDDALSRIVESFDATTAGALTGPLTAVKAALKSRDATALDGALAVAWAALALPTVANDDRAPELAAIALALDAVAAAN